MLPGVTPPIITLPKLKVAFLGLATNATTTATVSFGNFTPTTPGLMVVATACTAASASRIVSDISINSSTGNLNLASTSTGGSIILGIGSAVVTSGATAVSVTFSSTTGSASNSVGVWLLTGYSSTTPINVQKSTVGSTSIISLPINIDAYGVALFQLCWATSNSFTWSGASVQASATRGFSRYESANTTNVFQTSTPSYLVSSSHATLTVAGMIGGSWA